MQRGAAEPPLALMWKTVSEDCNLACDYCYYSAKPGERPAGRHRIDPALLDATIRRYLAHARGTATFLWQGGEPLLAGLRFFETVVALQRRHARPGTIVANALQTNGTLIDDAWALFFSKHRFLVGVSLDGPKEVHDRHRSTPRGRGSFDLVMRKLGHLRDRGVDFNILTVLSGANVGRARELMTFYARQNLQYVQFIPGMAFRAQRPDAPPEHLVTAQQYGVFLCEAFDAWYNAGRPQMSIGLFDSLLNVHAGRPASVCVHGISCSNTVVLEHDGRAYPCDFYLGDEWQLGTLEHDDLQALVHAPASERFRALKSKLAPQCRRCADLRLCHGGCPRHRTWARDGSVVAADYFCEAYRRLFAHSRERLMRLAEGLRRQSVAAHARSGRPWPSRNEPCVCGSARKFKQCCASLRDAMLLPAAN